MPTLEGHPHARIYRFVDKSELPEGHAVDIDYTRNITFIDRDLFNEMDPAGKRQMFRTQTPLVVGAPRPARYEPDAFSGYGSF